MKTFKEFLEEAYLFEMRKEDKVAGEIYIKVRPINKGLESFVAATGMRGFIS